jgi:hypothetical protein
MMSGAMLTGAVLAQPAAVSQSQFVNTLMPQPAQLSVNSGGLDISHGVGISLDKFHDDRLDNAVAWARERLQEQTGTLMQAGAASVVISADRSGPG